MMNTKLTIEQKILIADVFVEKGPDAAAMLLEEIRYDNMPATKLIDLLKEVMSQIDRKVDQGCHSPSTKDI